MKKLLAAILGLVFATAALATQIQAPPVPQDLPMLNLPLAQLVQNINNGSSGILAANLAPVSTAAGTTIQALQSFTLPANYLTRAGMTLHIRCWGTTAANANNKTMTLAFGSSAVATPTAATNAGTWSLEMHVMKTGASTQAVDGFGAVNVTPVAPFVTAGANTDTAAIVIACSGTDGTSSAGDIVANAMTVEVSQ